MFGIKYIGLFSRNHMGLRNNKNRILPTKIQWKIKCLHEQFQFYGKENLCKVREKRKGWRGRDSEKGAENNVFAFVLLCV